MSEEYVTKDYTKNGGAQELINDLVDGKIKFSKDKTEDLDINGFSGLSLDGFARRTSEMWQWLLEHMSNKHSITNETERYGIREEDFPSGELTSVVEFINKNADLSDNLLKEYIKKVVGTKDSYWNESVAKLIDYFYNQFQNDDGEIDHSKIKIGDVKNADAGNNFTDNNKIIDVAKWVIPWRNICDESYEEVRSNDKIIRVIKDAAKLQFTKKKNNKPSGVKEEDYKVEQGTKQIEGKEITVYDYLRLLMPEYPRIVEIEDLDRNFWVIGQVLTALCAFLFDDDGPLKNMFDGILDEICQLWENVFYLWLSAIQETKENYTTIQGVFLPVTPYENYPYLKYDNFYRTDLSGSKRIEEDYSKYTAAKAKEVLEDYYKQYLSYFKDLYKGTAICIVPEIRQINYAENYYAKATYLGFIVYDESVEGDNKVQYNVFSYPIIVDLTYSSETGSETTRGGYSTANGMEEIQDIGYYSLRETETQYTIARRITDQISDGATPYIKLIQPQFNITLNKQDNGFWLGEENEEIFHFYDKVSDIYEASIGVNKNRGLFYKVSQIGQQDGCYVYTLNHNNNFSSESSTISAPDSGTQIIDKKSGFYRGELISWYNISYMELKNKQFTLMPLNIGTMLEGNIPDDLMYTQHPFIDDDYTKNLSEEEIKAQDDAFITIIINDPQSVGIEENAFSLVTLERNGGLKAKDQTSAFKFSDARGNPNNEYIKTLDGSGYMDSVPTRQTRAYIIHPNLGYHQEFPNYPYSVERGSWAYKINYQGKNHIVIGDYLQDGNPDYHYAWGHNIHKAEFYIKKGDKGVKKDNWIIRYTSVYGYSFIGYDENFKGEYRSYYSDRDNLADEENISETIKALYKEVNDHDGTQECNDGKESYFRNGGLSMQVVSTLFFPNGEMQQFEVKRKSRNEGGQSTDYPMMQQLGDELTNMFKVSDPFSQSSYANADPDNKNGKNGEKYKALNDYPLRYHIWPRLGTKQSRSGQLTGEEQKLFDYVEVNEDE